MGPFLCPGNALSVERWPQGHGKGSGRHSPDLGRQPRSVLTREGFLSRCRHCCGQGSVGVLWPILWEHLFVSIPVGWPATAHPQMYQSKVPLFIESLTYELPSGSPAKWLPHRCWSPPGTRSSCLAIHCWIPSLKERKSLHPLVFSTSGSFCPTDHLPYIGSPFQTCMDNGSALPAAADRHKAVMMSPRPALHSACSCPLIILVTSL